jgi:hypothetical protein
VSYIVLVLSRALCFKNKYLLESLFLVTLQ